jgi:hypothetical protein
VQAGRSGDRIPVGSRFSAPQRNSRGAQPASYTITAGSFQEVKHQKRGVNHPPLSSAEVQERVALKHYSPCDRSWQVI